MNFTREPIIETVITPKEGYKLIVRNSKGAGQEEYFVDAVEVISFGNASFFRSLEKPKCFLVPVSDYELLETREARMVLKTPGHEKGIKIAGGREAPMKVKDEAPAAEEEGEETVDGRPDKRRERRSRSRKRRGKGEGEEESVEPQEVPVPPAPVAAEERRGERPGLIPPPTTLISESITRYKALAAGEEAPVEAKEPLRVLTPPPLVRLNQPEEEKDQDDDEELPF